jgi:hypothetical protein
MNSEIIDKIAELPAAQQQQLLDFAEFLVRKYGKSSLEKFQKRQAGTLKGILLYMAEDFDAPLDDFKPFMD